MRKLGQHFLNNRLVLETIAEAIDLRRGDTIIEIGPGHGELTEVLLRRSRAGHLAIQIIAIERDAQLAGQLKEKFSHNTDIEIVEGDVLKLLPSLCATHPMRPTSHLAPRTSHLKIVGNIPYYITGHLLRIIGELALKPSRCVFLVQQEVAERIATRPPHMNRLAASVQFWARPSIVDRVPRSEFTPPPHVDSAIIELTIRTDSQATQAKRYYAAVRALFQQPRKTIENNLATALRTHRQKQAAGDISPRERAAVLLRELGIDPSGRPHGLSIEDICRIVERLGGALDE
jgi:16S rRNA (adenine1518-N6/adenine1519-N6)-dimethyltransferase